MNDDLKLFNMLHPIATRKYGIELPGYKGKYYVIDKRHMGVVGDEYCNYYLLESEHYGDEVPCIVINDYYDIIDDECWNGLDDYLENEFDC